MRLHGCTHQYLKEMTGFSCIILSKAYLSNFLDYDILMLATLVWLAYSCLCVWHVCLLASLYAPPRSCVTYGREHERGALIHRLGTGSLLDPCFHTVLSKISVNMIEYHLNYCCIFAQLISNYFCKGTKLMQISPQFWYQSATYR